MVVNRARMIFDNIVQRFGAARLNVSSVSKLEPEIAELEKWNERSEIEARYWLSLKRDIERLRSMVSMETLLLKGADVERGRRQLDNTQTPNPLDDAVEAVTDLWNQWNQSL